MHAYQNVIHYQDLDDGSVEVVVKNCQFQVKLFISRIKMRSESRNLKTPQNKRQIHRQNFQIENPHPAKIKTGAETVQLAHMVGNNDGIIKESFLKFEQEQKFVAKSNTRQTEKKSKVISDSPLQKTSRKKYLTVVSTFTNKPERGNVLRNEVDLESDIANEEHQDILENSMQEVQASMHYFDDEPRLTNHQLAQNATKRVPLTIQNQQKVAMFSHFDHNNEYYQGNLFDFDLHKSNLEDEPTKPMPIKRKIVLSQKRRSQQAPKLTNIFVKQSYRYCIGCQNPVLEANIRLHEQECSSYQKIYQMTYKEIVQVLKNVISQLSKQIQAMKSTLAESDLFNLKVYTEGVLKESQLISLTGEQSEIYNFKFQSAKQVNKKWVLFAEQICKLNWFIKLRQSIKQKHKE